MKIIPVLCLTILCFGCGYSSKKPATQPGVVPVVAAIMPASLQHGGSDFTLMVTGSNFNANAVGRPKTLGPSPK